MAQYDHNQETAYLAHVMQGAGSLEPYNDHTRQALEKVVKRLRDQVRMLARTCKTWQNTNVTLTGEIERRYAAYEGALHFQDLRQYWALYRQAMQELHQEKNSHWSHALTV